MSQQMLENALKVVIVGGGTAGWMTAACLSKALDKKVDVTLVESSNITTVGVGEATFSFIKSFFDFLGLQEHEWMPMCKATYKLAIKFVNWNAAGRHFFHTFEGYDSVGGFSMLEWWLKLKRYSEPFDHSCFTVPILCENQKSPRYVDGKAFDHRTQYWFSPEYIAEKRLITIADDVALPPPYAYHFDANLVAEFLKHFATQRGVKQIVDDMLDVKLGENGSIEYITTREHGDIRGDLFIDCTGFRGLLINQALGEPFISFSESLLGDRAIAMQIPTDGEKNGINPYTTATALSSGWVWDIPLYERNGTGYVYSSAFLSQEEAEQEFRQHLGAASDNCSASHIKIRVGRNRNSWVKNCVAIGLSSGFVEPLESTGIFFIQHAIEQLIYHFPNQSFREESRQNYNKAIANCIDAIRDFLILHYHATDRNNTEFWRAVKHDIQVPNELQERLKLWKIRLPNDKNIDPNYHGFKSGSYAVMLLGLNYVPQESLPVLDHLDEQKAIDAFSSLKKRSSYLNTTLPSHYEYLTQMYAMSKR